MTKRTCGGTTKAGKPCGAAPLIDGDFCMAHADEQTRASVGFGGARAGAMGGRPRKPTATEVERRLIEENVVAWQRPYWRTLGYDMVLGEQGYELVEIPGGGAKVFGQSKDGETIVSDYDDLGAMINAAEKLRDRVFGRPKQTSEVTLISESEMDAAIRRMEEQLAANDPAGPGDSAGKGRSVQGAAPAA